jgi:hypothetical protein
MQRSKCRPLELQKRDWLLLFTKIVTSEHVDEVEEAGETRDVDHPTASLLHDLAIYPGQHHPRVHVAVLRGACLWLQ